MASACNHNTIRNVAGELTRMSAVESGRVRLRLAEPLGSLSAASSNATAMREDLSRRRRIQSVGEMEQKSNEKKEHRTRVRWFGQLALCLRSCKRFCMRLLEEYKIILFFFHIIPRESYERTYSLTKL